jgi:hypothetical protein
VIEPSTLPPALVRTAWTDEGEIMGVRHRELFVEGVQFTPSRFSRLMARPCWRTSWRGSVASAEVAPMTPNEAFASRAGGRTLDEARRCAVFEAVLAEDVDPAVLGGLLAARHMRGETADELSVRPGRFAPCDCRRGRRRCRRHVRHRRRRRRNVQTSRPAAALRRGGAGVPVVKHGNRAVSGPRGSADVLDASASRSSAGGQLGRCLREVGFVYLHAPRHHPVMARVAPSVARSASARSSTSSDTGQSAGVRRQVIGVPTTASPSGWRSRWAGSGPSMPGWCAVDQRFDELALSGPTRVCSVRAGRVDSF